MIYIKENGVTVKDTTDGSVSISAEFPSFTAWLEPSETQILLRGLLRWKLERTPGDSLRNIERIDVIQLALDELERNR